LQKQERFAANKEQATQQATVDFDEREPEFKGDYNEQVRLITILSGGG